MQLDGKEVECAPGGPSGGGSGGGVGNSIYGGSFRGLPLADGVGPQVCERMCVCVV